MSYVTYQDPAVVSLVGKNYLAVRVDAEPSPETVRQLRSLGYGP